MTSSSRHEQHRYEYMSALSQYDLPYYALAYMVHRASAAVAGDAFAGEDPLTTGIRSDYLWYVTDGVASRMQTPMSDELLAGRGLVDKIVPGLTPVCLMELGKQALVRLAERRPEYSPAELSGHALTVNLLMADAHTELYGTGYDPDHLPTISMRER